MAEFVATVRPVGGVLMLSGALALDMIGVDAWPAKVPAQIHYTTKDPFRNQEWIDAVVAQVRSAQAAVEVFDYPGAGHLFTDRDLSKPTCLWCPATANGGKDVWATGATPRVWARTSTDT